MRHFVSQKESDKAEEAFGRAVRYFRKRQESLSQEVLAELASIDRQTVNRTENLKYTPGLDKALRMILAMGIPLEVFFKKVDEFIKEDTLISHE